MSESDDDIEDKIKQKISECNIPTAIGLANCNDVM